MNVIDQLFLLATGLVALYLVVLFYRNYRETKTTYNLYYAASFAVLLVAGLLLILLTYAVLANPLVVIVAALIPLTLATGLVTQFYPQHERNYLLFAIIGLLAIAITRYVGPQGVGTAILATVHSIAGLTIFFVPIFVSRAKKVPTAFTFVTVGGTLIGIGGISLAFLKAGMPILSADIIFLILAPLLLLMAGAFAYGFVKGQPAKQAAK